MTIHYMPSEIARLVLGYLKETNCKESAKLFIKESPHLTEYANGLRHGITYSTIIGGKKLNDFFNNFTFDQNINHLNDNNMNICKSSEEIESISKQLSSLESNLTQFMQTIKTSIDNNNRNNYRIISPSVISSSSPLYVNTIGYNSTPIVVNEQNLKVNQNVLNPNPNQFKTPSKSVSNSPRRKSLPRRRILSGSTPLKNANIDLNIDSNELNTISDELRDESEPQLKIDINEPLVQPEVIVGELINYQPLHEALAENINKIFNNSNNNEDKNENNHKSNEENNSEQKDSNNEDNERNKCNDKTDAQEIQISDDVVNDIMANLELAPEYNTLLDIITEKELQMTPYKNVFSNESDSSVSSLNTPQTPQNIKINDKSVDNSSVVKNLLPDFRTPEKTVTLYAAHNLPNCSRLTPIKVTPIKLLRTNLTPCKTLFLPEFDCVTTSSPKQSLFMPKVSILTEDSNCFSNIMTQNSVSNNSNNYSVRIQANKATNPQFFNSNRRRNKKVDFEKPASELQYKRLDSTHRKILPKPRICSTTITPVCNDTNETPVPNHTLVVDGNTDSFSQKRPNSDIDESPNKIRAADVRLPTLNILRKMNVNKFLNQLHSNQ